MSLANAPAGYLAQVVEQVLPTAPALQRRQAALFEPVRPNEGAMLPESSDERVHAPPPALPRADRPVEAPARGTRPAERSVGAEPATPHVPHVDTTVAAARPALAPREPPLIAASVRLPPPLPQGTITVPQAPAPPLSPTRTPRHDATTPPAAVSMSVRETPAHEAPPLRRAPAPHAASAAPPRVATPPPGLPPSRAATRAVAQAAPRPSMPTPVQALPPIEVTIGRIEVRAVAAPPAAPRGRASAPRMSLDQYLKDRDGGAR